MLPRAQAAWGCIRHRRPGLGTLAISLFWPVRSPKLLPNSLPAQTEHLSCGTCSRLPCCSPLGTLPALASCPWPGSALTGPEEEDTASWADCPAVMPPAGLPFGGGGEGGLLVQGPLGEREGERNVRDKILEILLSGLLRIWGKGTRGAARQKRGGCLLAVGSRYPKRGSGVGGSLLWRVIP